MVAVTVLTGASTSDPTYFLLIVHLTKVLYILARLH